jgi:hypothetical protein
MTDQVTHYVLWDDPAEARTWVLALCGVIIRRGESDGQPTCPTCRKHLAEADEEEDAHV